VRGQRGDTPQSDGAVDGNRHRVKLDEIVEQTAQVALTSLCESRLADTAAMPIVLFPIHNQEDPVWKQHLEVVSNP
jgi:hypothetical protein